MPNIQELPLARRPIVDENLAMYKPIALGKMTVKCPNCDALHWMDERLKGSSKRNPKFGTCCLSGKVSIPTMVEPPVELKRLFNAASEKCASAADQDKSKHFLANITRFNAAFALASLGVKTHHILGRGLQQFTIQGALYHRLNAVRPEDEVNSEHVRKYAEIYLLSDAAAMNQRIQNNSIGGGLQNDVLQIIQDVMHCRNHYVTLYKSAVERVRENPVGRCYARFDHRPTKDQHRYNLPTNAEVAVVLHDSDSLSAPQDIMIQCRNTNQMTRIFDTHPAYQPLTYVLLFPFGEHGWHPNIPLTNRDTGRAEALNQHDNDNDSDNDGEEREGRGRQGRVTPMEYYAYRLHRQEDESDHLFRAKRLFQQYLVDGWALTEQSRLRWVQNNQATLRSDVYRGLADAVAANANVNPDSIGQHFILPSSFKGGWRNMHQLYQDSMANGRPDFFLTITCNPTWEEIVQEAKAMGSDYDSSDRPDFGQPSLPCQGKFIL